MATKTAPPAKPAAGEKPAGSDPRPARRSAPNVWWLLLQGDVLELVHSETIPDITVKPGERRKKVLAGFPDEASARKRYDNEAPRARGIVGKGEARK